MSNKRLVILGGGESGVGAALLAQQQGFEVFVSDKSTIAEKYIQELTSAGIPFESGQHTDALILNASEVIKSPGIPDKAPIIQSLKANGIPVIGEIEFASRYTHATIVGITGSNGKTTTTQLTYHVLNSHLNVAMGGNVGKSLGRLLATEPAYEYYVLELSSFQLDDIRQFRPHIAVLLNITPDHLDRYNYQMSEYVAAKFRITMNQREADLFIHHATDPEITAYLSEHTVVAKKMAIDPPALNANNELPVGGALWVWDKVALKGRHNLFNAACAIQVATALNIPTEKIQSALETFENVPHRLETIAQVGGVEYINDSKATNVDAVWYALDAMTKPIVWIVGGTDKGNDYAPLFDLVQSKVKAIICLGVDNQKLLQTFGSMVEDIVETKSAFEAVQAAARKANTGDVVLLSPACASFDLFKNYEDRGQQFKAAVQQLKV
jgi:UDP-N-acetylmuramoylalanine--D-glutamate ligase